MGFGVPELPSGRESFAPDVSYFDEVLKHDRIDDLFSTGWMEMAL